MPVAGTQLATNPVFSETVYVPDRLFSHHHLKLYPVLTGVGSVIQEPYLAIISTLPVQLLLLKLIVIGFLF